MPAADVVGLVGDAVRILLGRVIAVIAVIESERFGMSGMCVCVWGRG